MEKKWTILVADDHPLILEALRNLLEEHWKDATIKVAANKLNLWAQLQSGPVDVLVQDVKFGPDDARSFLPRIREDYPDLKIIVLTSLESKEAITSLINMGIQGYVLKSEKGENLVKAIEEVLRDGTYFSEQVLRTQQENTTTSHLNLSPRELEVLKGILSEWSTKTIAERLFLSEKTVEHYRSSLFVKFDVKNVTGLVKKAILNGFWED